MKGSETFNRRILVIDDNPNIHEDFKKILAGKDTSYETIDRMAEAFFHGKPPSSPPPGIKPEYHLDFASQGLEGIDMVNAARLEGNPYMVVFVDMRIPPGINGLETTQRIIQKDPLVQIVICTAYSDYSFTDIKREIGFTSNLLILKKPFDISEVEQMASTLTEKWILNQQSRLVEKELTRLVEQRTQILTQVNQSLEQEIIERKRAENSIKILTQENIRIQEKERQRIACDLHDSVAQDLAALLIKQELILNCLETGLNGNFEQDMKDSIRILKTTIQNVRNISYNLRPPSLNEFGIVHAMNRLCETFFIDDDIDISFSTSGMKDRRFDYTTEINLYRIFQECLNNIKKHARPSHVTVCLSASESGVILSVKDDGVGFHADSRLLNAVLEKRMGLKGIEERVNLIHGEFDIRSSPGKGTEVIIRIADL